MDYLNKIAEYRPENEQEAADKKIILSFAGLHPENVLLRENQIAHITSSGFIINKTLDQVLLVHHNIRDTWAWTGGHADGDSDLLQVACNEAMEETGISKVAPLSAAIASLDVLPTFGHVRKGVYVTAHLHLSVAYILIADKAQPLHVRPAENTAVGWFGKDFFTRENFDASDVYLYNKLIGRARKIAQ